MTDEVKDAPTTEESKKYVEGSEVKDPIVEGLKEIEAKIKPKTENEDRNNEVKNTEEIKAELPKGPTIGEVFKNEKKEEISRVVPEAPFLEIKNQNKELKKELKELKELVSSGASKREVNASLLEIAEEHNVDIDFLNKLATTIKQQAKSEAEAELEAKMRPLAEKQRYDSKDAIFNYHYEKTLESMPEYKDIVNKEIIKSLSDLNENSSKTFPQLIESAYGHLLKGKKTIDSVSPIRQTTDEIVELDFDRANKDGEYFKKIMANPKLKKEYNAKMIKAIKI